VPVESAGRVVAQRQDAIEAALESPPERVERDALEGPLENPRAAVVEERPRAAHVAVGQVLEADRHLDQALQRLAVAAVGAQPVGLEQLVYLEVQMGMEEERSLHQRDFERRILRIERA